VILIAIAAIGSLAAIPPIPQQVREGLDRTLGAKGTYVSEESAYRYVWPRSDIPLTVAARHVSPPQIPESWVTFSPAVRAEGMVNGELVLKEEEVNPVIAVALNSGLEVTGLGPAFLFERPSLMILNITGQGTFQALGRAVRAALSETRRGGAKTTATLPVVRDAIDAGPINAILSMRGAVSDGIYRAAIGRVVLVNETPIGREMGINTRVKISGTNEQAFIDADIIANADELPRVLVAIRTKSLEITSIRNHLTGEHPVALFVHLEGTGKAADLAKSFRYVLDVEVGAVRLPAR
jgi:hypothetical protein